ncbi:unnamed protein product [Ceutorhynchus assimilis]|uniref:Zinc finger protein n=1 Tax=Ceutorhynchus assimilis TaxID=467358 RepID=A0A9P0DLL9_9CUCU|nr:unnamed protein product [Ceutorhynchus assimilis]
MEEAAHTSEEILVIHEETIEDPESIIIADEDRAKLKTELHIKCRGCFIQEDEMHYLFSSIDGELNLAYVITKCTGYSCEKDDGFPPYLCLRCTTILVDFFNFKDQIRKTTRLVENLLGKSLKQLETDPHPENDPHPDNSNTDEVFIPDLAEISGTTLECKFCPSTFAIVEECDTHMAKVHKKNPFYKYALFKQRVEPQSVTIKQESIVEESLRNVPKKMCRICQKNIPEDEFKMHWEIHKVNICEQCGHRFIRVSDMNLHKQSVHNDVRNFPCNICEKAFKTKPFLKRHMNIHINPRRFCCDKCGERFNDSGTLKTHIRLKHVGTKDFICPICGLAFNLKPTLDKHVIRHSENRVPSFFCEICKSPFQDKSSLKRHHTVKHTNDFIRPSCNICGKSYSTGTRLRKHIENNHGLNEVVRKKRGRKKLALSKNYHVSESTDESSGSSEDEHGSDSKLTTVSDTSE